MRRAMLLAATLTAISAISVLSASAAQAEEWCGYAAHANSIIQCGYSSLAGCENATGQGGMCFVNPDYAFDTRRATPRIARNG